MGFVFGIAAALAVARVQHAVHGFAWVEWAWWQLGPAQGLGAMTGDAVKSFFKRRRGIPPGARWLPADQLDFIVGALLLSAPALKLGLPDIAAILALTFVGHVAVNHVAWSLGIRDAAW